MLVGVASLPPIGILDHKKAKLPKHLQHNVGAKIQLVSHEFEYFYQCIMTFWGLRDFKGPTLMHHAHLFQN